MKGIILAAGRGSRMGDQTKNLPKCRSILHGKELIQWQLDALYGAKIKDVAIVRGYLGETFTFDLSYFNNPRWANTNMVVSLMMAKDWLLDYTCIASYSDIVYSKDAVKRLIKAKGDIVITYDPNWKELWSKRFSNPLLDAETFILKNKRVIEIGNRASTIDEIQGQYMGLIKFTPVGWKQVQSYLGNFSQDELDNMDMTTLFQGLISVNYKIYATPINDCWFEVDSINDLELYNSSQYHNNLIT